MQLNAYNIRRDILNLWDIHAEFSKWEKFDNSVKFTQSKITTAAVTRTQNSTDSILGQTLQSVRYGRSRLVKVEFLYMDEEK